MYKCEVKDLNDYLTYYVEIFTSILKNLIRKIPKIKNEYIHLPKLLQTYKLVVTLQFELELKYNNNIISRQNKRQLKKFKICKYFIRIKDENKHSHIDKARASQQTAQWSVIAYQNSSVTQE